MSTMITGEAKKSFKAIVVKELPEKGILNNLYFVLNGDEGDNKYDEYIWVKDPDTQQYMWEKVGYSYVDLTPYYTKEEVDGKLSPINNNLLKLNTETTFHPVININQIKPGGGQGTNKDRWTIDQAVLAAWQWINEDLTNRGDYLSPGISIMFRSTNLRDVNGFDGAWLIHNYSDVDFSQDSFTNSDKWCRVLTEADFKFEVADETYSGFLLNTDYIKFNNAVKSITAHATNYNNPHQVTKNQVGLGNVDNTSDLDKPLSNNDKTALDLKIGSISIGTAINGLGLGLYGAKENTIIGGQTIANVPLGTVVIPNVTRDQDGLFPAAKLGSLDSMQEQIISSQDTTRNLQQKIGTTVINLSQESQVSSAILNGYSLIRYAPSWSSEPITIINEGGGEEHYTFTQYKYAGGQQFKRTIHAGNGTISDWKVVGPTVIEVAATSVRLKDDAGEIISSSNLPVIGSGAEVGLVSTSTLDRLDDNISHTEDYRIKSAAVKYNIDNIVIGLGTIEGQTEAELTYIPITIQSATEQQAGLLTANQVNVLNNSAYQAAAAISSIVPTPSSDRITLKLKQNNGDTSDMPLVLANTTNAGLMSPTDKSKLDGIESLDSSDITALFS